MADEFLAETDSVTVEGNTLVAEPTNGDEAVEVDSENLVSADFERAAGDPENGSLVLVRNDGSRDVLNVSEEEGVAILGALRESGVESAAAVAAPEPDGDPA